MSKGDDYDEELSRNPDDAYMTETQHAALGGLLATLPPAAKVLDFACGTGRITQVIERYGFEVYGLDISPTMLEVAREKCPATTFVHADGSQPVADLPSMDVVTAFRFFGNAQETLRRECLSQMVAYLKPGGYLIANNHRNPWSVRNVLLRLRGSTPLESLSYWHMKSLLEESGLEVVKTIGIGFWMFRSRWSSDIGTTHRWGRRLEVLSRFPGTTPLCPDVIFLARKPVA